MPSGTALDNVSIITACIAVVPKCIIHGLRPHCVRLSKNKD